MGSVLKTEPLQVLEDERNVIEGLGLAHMYGS